MPKRERQGNNPKRRIAAAGSLAEGDLESLIQAVRYTGSAQHKKKHADYDLDPPVSPRRSKSLCDGKRSIRLMEATRLFRQGLKRGMVSAFSEGDHPKYVWAVDEEGEAYEAKVGADGLSYHGYRLGNNDKSMRRRVIAEWNKRCPGH